MEKYHNNIKKNIIAISIACYILGCGYYLNNIQLLDVINLNSLGK